MTSSPIHIFTAKLRTPDRIHGVLRKMDQQCYIEVNTVHDFIQRDQLYHVIHNLMINGNTHKQNLVRGDSLSLFIRDYIEPGIGDGLDMLVFPENGDWCLVFDIDGRTLLKSQYRRRQAS